VSAPLKTYDFARVVLVLGGYDISGYGEDGGVDVENAAVIAEDTVGADGDVTISRTNDARLYVTINVMETSRSYRDLALLQAAQEAQGEITALPFMLRDLNNGDQITSNNAVFLERPTSSKGRAVGERAFKLLLPYSARTQLHGALITA
jgi:hypothetical protein